MYPGMDRSWPQPYSPSDRQSQTGWFPLQDDQPRSQTGWVPEDADDRVYSSAPVYAPAPTPPYVWTGEPGTQPSPRISPYMASPYPRPLPSPLGGVYSRPTGREPAGNTPERRRGKEIAIGRWNSEEHQLFLHGLETFQGPAWGEIARLIGSRTSTQVRTHAQKFFTKMARLNQTLPHFEAQIQKERARLAAQGANVTPTAQSANMAATLSPRKRLATAATSSPRESLKRYKEENAVAPFPTALRYPEGYDSKPRIYTGAADAATVAYGSTSPSAGPDSKEWTQWTEDGRQWPRTSPTSTSVSLLSTQVDDAPAAAESDSLPSMDKMLYRSAAA